MPILWGRGRREACQALSHMLQENFAGLPFVAAHGLCPPLTAWTGSGSRHLHLPPTQWVWRRGGWTLFFPLRELSVCIYYSGWAGCLHYPHHGQTLRREQPPPISYAQCARPSGHGTFCTLCFWSIFGSLQELRHFLGGGQGFLAHVICLMAVASIIISTMLCKSSRRMLCLSALASQHAVNQPQYVSCICLQHNKSHALMCMWHLLSVTCWPENSNGMQQLIISYSCHAHVMACLCLCLSLCLISIFCVCSVFHNTFSCEKAGGEKGVDVTLLVWPEKAYGV